MKIEFNAYIKSTFLKPYEYYYYVAKKLAQSKTLKELDIDSIEIDGQTFDLKLMRKEAKNK